MTQKGAFKFRDTPLSNFKSRKDLKLAALRANFASPACGGQAKFGIIMLFLAFSAQASPVLVENPLEPRLEFSCRRIRGDPRGASSFEQVVRETRDLAKSPIPYIRISSAVVLGKMGYKSEAEQILAQTGRDPDSWLQFETAKAYLELGKIREEDGVIIDDEEKRRYRESGSEILKRLENSSDILLLVELAEEYLRLDIGENLKVGAGTYVDEKGSPALKSAESILDRIGNKARVETEKLRGEIKLRRDILRLINQTRQLNGIDKRIKAAGDLLKMSSSVWTMFEDNRLIKKAIRDLVRSSDPEIRAGMAKKLGENDVVLDWQAEVLVDLIRDDKHLVAQAGILAAESLGKKYIQEPALWIDYLIKIKMLQRQTHLFYNDYTQGIGELSLREEIVPVLLKAWRRWSDPYTSGMILDALGFWGINSPEIKGFLEKVKKEEQARTPPGLVDEILKFIQDAESHFQTKLSQIKTRVLTGLREGRIPPELTREDLLFPAALWTIYRESNKDSDIFTIARDLLLDIDRLLPFPEQRDGWRWDIGLVLYSLMFRPDPSVLEKYKSHIFNGENIVQQSHSLEALTQPWWIKDSKVILKDFLAQQLDAAFDYSDSEKAARSLSVLEMAMQTVNALLQYGGSLSSEKAEDALTALRLLDKFPPLSEMPRRHPARRLLWMLGEGLRQGP